MQMRGQFRPNIFSALSNDQAHFLRVFVQARGNLSELEKVLGVSYPTIRGKLDEINKILEQAAERPLAQGRTGSAPQETPGAAETPRQAILREVAAGRLSAADALQQLRHLRSET
jgi:hypothetical protein